MQTSTNVSNRRDKSSRINDSTFFSISNFISKKKAVYKNPKGNNSTGYLNCLFS